MTRGLLVSHHFPAFWHRALTVYSFDQVICQPSSFYIPGKVISLRPHSFRLSSLGPPGPLTETSAIVMNPNNFRSFIDKGRWLVHHMPRNVDINQSPYNGQELLWRSGWRETNNTPYPPLDSQRHRHLLYDHCKISKDDQRNHHITLTHAAWGQAIINGQWQNKWPPSQGVYSCVFNPGAIMVLNSTSPEKVPDEMRVHPIHMVPLRHWSEIIWLRWKQFCQEQRCREQDIRSIVQCDITNPQTCAVVEEVLRRSGYEKRPFADPSYSSPQTGPITFVRDQEKPLMDECFYALMSTDNASGPAYFLGQHQRELGHLAVMSITCVYHWEMFTQESLSLVFHIAPWR